MCAKRRFRATTQAASLALAYVVTASVAEVQVPPPPLSIDRLTAEEFAELASFIVLHYDTAPEGQLLEAHQLHPSSLSTDVQRVSTDADQEEAAPALESIASLPAGLRSPLPPQEHLVAEARRGSVAAAEILGLEAAASVILAGSEGKPLALSTEAAHHQPDSAADKSMPESRMDADAVMQPLAQSWLEEAASLRKGVSEQAERQRLESSTESAAWQSLRGSAVTGVGIVFVVGLAVAGIIFYLLSNSQAEPEASSRAHTLMSGSKTSYMSGKLTAGGVSDTTEQFIARLEEIIEQMASMLRGTVRMAKNASEANGPTDWRYIAAVPNDQAKPASGLGENVVPALESWRHGTMGWWTTMESFTQSQEPLGQLRLSDIEGVTHEETEHPDVVVVKTRDGSDVAFIFRSFKEARTWSSTLTALIEQLHDDE
eukprot:TRINITY_DN39942_c0_g1_i1.p1 TRINITY_DN39942_c0_g1~~TRINITY_DN39942_c0_g1_i1.p1  ORF type:complete len:429 (+),score=74.62 TRINITY_DN39942_c0_g1_i1:58-1344(+)